MKPSKLGALFLAVLTFLCPQPWAPLFSDAEGGAQVSSRFGSSSGNDSEPVTVKPAPLRISMPAEGSGSEVSIVGAVPNPGTYRVRGATRLSEALALAGGIQGQGSLRNLEVRTGNNSQKYDLFLFESRGDLRQNPYIRSGDVIFVPIRLGTVQVGGAVRRHGTFELIPGMTIENAVQSAGGLAVDFANNKPFKILQLNEDGRQTDILSGRKSRYDDIKTQMLNDGQIVIVPSKTLKEETVNYKTATTPGTSLYLPSPEASVYMVGAFYKPGVFPFDPSFNLQRYIALAGGMNPLAKTKAAYISRSEGAKQKIDVYEPLPLQPGDTVTVPEKAIRPEFWPSFILSVASFALTAFLAYDRLKGN